MTPVVMTVNKISVSGLMAAGQLNPGCSGGTRIIHWNMKVQIFSVWT